MDISSVVIDIPVDTQPLQPWFRIAHHWHFPPKRRQPRISRRRKLQDWELVMPTSGEMWLWWGDTQCSHPLKPGQCAVIPPQTEHVFCMLSGAHIAVHFDLHHQPIYNKKRMGVFVGPGVERNDGDRIPWFRARRSDDDEWLFPAVQSVNRGRFERGLLRIVNLINHDGPDSLSCQREGTAILFDLLAELDHAPHHQARLADQRILNAIASVPIYTAPSIAELAADCGLSEGAFRNAFIKSTGQRPHRFFEKRRIDAALHLLRDTDMSVSDIAESVGYEDPFHFSRACKRVSGQAPSAWRNVD